MMEREQSGMFSRRSDETDDREGGYDDSRDGSERGDPADGENLSFLRFQSTEESTCPPTNVGGWGEEILGLPSDRALWLKMPKFSGCPPQKRYPIPAPPAAKIPR